MKLRVFLDTNVFIYSFEFPESNSAKIIDMLNDYKIEAVISEMVLKEVIFYFERKHSKELAKKFRKYLLDNCSLVFKEEVVEQIKELKGKIKDKDIEQLASAQKYGLKLISYDRDFNDFEEYMTPKRFLGSLNLKFEDSEF
ncbi:MAG: PIN domain-containing protein [Nanoarchaeota archaeon]